MFYEALEQNYLIVSDLVCANMLVSCRVPTEGPLDISHDIISIKHGVPDHG